MTTGGSAVMSLDQRLAAPKAASPEMCSLNMGTMNFALYPMIARVTDWTHDWERPFLEASDDLVFRNTPRDIAHVLHEMGTERGARFEFECYDIGHLDMLRHFADRGLVEPPYFIQLVFGVLGGMAAEPEALVYLKAKADRLFGSDYLFSVLAAGRAQMPMAALSASMGGHVRVGLEDSLYIGAGQLARSNAAAGRECARHRRGAGPQRGRPGDGPGDARPEGCRRGRVLSGHVIRPACRADAEGILACLRALSAQDGAVHAASAEDYLRHGFGPNRVFQAMVVARATTLDGVAVFFPTFSTQRGRPGVYVQDLYLAPSLRRQGFGRRLLAAVRGQAAGWGADHLLLMVARGNTAGAGFYERLGFREMDRYAPLVLDGRALAALEDSA